MANYYYITIKSEKMTQEIAAEIFTEFSKTNKIRNFNYIIDGYLYIDSRGLSMQVGKILDKYGFTDEEIDIKDEFELANLAEVE